VNVARRRAQALGELCEILDVTRASELVALLKTLLELPPNEWGRQPTALPARVLARGCRVSGGPARALIPAAPVAAATAAAVMAGGIVQMSDGGKVAGPREPLATSTGGGPLRAAVATIEQAIGSVSYRPARLIEGSPKTRTSRRRYRRRRSWPGQTSRLRPADGS
jgi:hypothetical protein